MFILVVVLYERFSIECIFWDNFRKASYFCLLIKNSSVQLFVITLKQFTMYKTSSAQKKPVQIKKLMKFVESKLPSIKVASRKAHFW